MPPADRPRDIVRPRIACAAPNCSLDASDKPWCLKHLLEHGEYAQEIRLNLARRREEIERVREHPRSVNLSTSLIAEDVWNCIVEHGSISTVLLAKLVGLGSERVARAYTDALRRGGLVSGTYKVRQVLHPGDSPTLPW